MFTVIKTLKQEDSINVIYHLIMIMNKGKNEPDNNIEFNKITSRLPDNLNMVINEILDEINFYNIDKDELLDNYIVLLYKMLEEITTSDKNLNLERGRDRLRDLYNLKS